MMRTDRARKVIYKTNDTSVRSVICNNTTQYPIANIITKETINNPIPIKNEAIYLPSLFLNGIFCDQTYEHR